MNERARPERLTQNRVVTLSNVVAKIETLEQRRAKTRDLKQAMMQELLTGITRFVSPEVAHA